MRLRYLVCAQVVVIVMAVVTAPAVTYEKGDIFAAVNSGNVNHYASDGTFIETLNIGSTGYTTGMAFDSDGNLYVTGFSANKLAKFDVDGNLVDADFASGLSTPESVVFDKAGNMYVGNLGNGIRKYDSDGTFLGTVYNTRVDWFDLSADQSTFVYGQEGNDVRTVSNGLPGTPGPDFVADGGVSEAFAMRILDDGGLLVADHGDVKRFDSSGSLLQTYDVANVDGWFALNLDPDGTSFWSGSFLNDTLYKFDIDAGGAPLQTLATIVGGSRNLYGVAVFGEITAGGPPTVPEPGSTVCLLTLAYFGLVAIRRRINR